MFCRGKEADSKANETDSYESVCAGMATICSKEAEARAPWVVLPRTLAPLPGTVSGNESAPVFGESAVVAARLLSPNGDKPDSKMARGKKEGRKIIQEQR
jgi:hypothetical protein